MRRGDRPAVWLEQTDNIEQRSKQVETVNKEGGYIAWPGTAPSAFFYDASRPLKNGRPAYEFSRNVRIRHATQFPEEASGKVVLNPATKWQKVALTPSNRIRPGDDYCTALKLDYPTFDIPGNMKKLGIEQ
jgi:hypothetical protein